MDGTVPPRNADVPESEIAERLRWLLGLRWLIVPLFVAVDVANDLLTNRRAPWTALGIGGLLLAANGLYSYQLSRRISAAALLRWARFESAVVVAIPVLVAFLHGESASALRFGVLVGVVGAAAILPRSSEVAVVGMWAICAVIVGDAVAAGFDPARIPPGAVARWAMEGGIIVTVSVIACHLHSTREWALQRLGATQEKLDRAQGEWETAFDGLHELVFTTDRAGRILRANRAFARRLAARPHELVGRRLAEVLAGHPDRWWSVPGDGIVEVEDPLFDTVFEISSTRNGDRVIRIARDVGEERQLYARLVQADKLAAVGVLASGVAHEINNPTAFVTSNLTELKRYLGAYEGAISELAELGMQAGRANEVRALLARAEVAFARREAGASVSDSLVGMGRIEQISTHLRSVARRDLTGEPAGPVDLGEVLQMVVRTASADLRAASAQVDLAGPVHVIGHRGELVDVVLNLVVNAIQAREEGRPNHVTLSLSREGASGVIRIQDTGRGIAPAHMKRLFEPFFTTKAAGEGTGLGLSLARRIVLAHGGSLDVSSELGVGSVFTVRLPALESERAVPAAPAA
ncbi:sensor histidine kinase [Anaeromyxobacter oryzisoli]|uniref:sensor histidine kinase n=1 Tax=Anaeromyxobacter oryzisoli TaxID=2925408 RepID=UPI001F58B869|nr:ATP-binding protein [Anaeromyxobacter sp. SG63]